MSKFKVGDRVEITKADGKAEKGLKGTIRGISSQPDARNYGVEFDNEMGGHDLHSCVGSCPKCQDGHGWWVRESSIELFSPKFEVGQIYRVGKLSHQHEWEDAIIKLSGNRPFGFMVKAIRGEAPGDFGERSEYARTLTLLTGSQIGEAIRKWDDEHATKKTGVKEVKRPAKPGEYIKIVSAWANEGYKNGDILKAIRRFNENSVVFDDTKICVCDDEYVVLEGYKPEQKGKHSYADTEIAEAKKLCGEMFIESIDGSRVFSIRVYDKANGGYHCVTSNENETQAILTSFGGDHDTTGTAKCSDHDEYNVWIGRCVALCKALHKPIPAFIMGG